jgi:hypothetical protein
MIQYSAILYLERELHDAIARVFTRNITPDIAALTQLQSSELTAYFAPCLFRGLRADAPPEMKANEGNFILDLYDLNQ